MHLVANDHTNLNKPEHNLVVLVYAELQYSVKFPGDLSYLHWDKFYSVYTEGLVNKEKKQLAK